MLLRPVRARPGLPLALVQNRHQPPVRRPHEQRRVHADLGVVAPRPRARAGGRAGCHPEAQAGIVSLWAGLSWPGVALAQAPQHAVPPGLRCPGDKVVWVNTRSGIYHFQGERYFGSTKEGKFLCEHDADTQGDRPTHNGQ